MVATRNSLNALGVEAFRLACYKAKCLSAVLGEGGGGGGGERWLHKACRLELPCLGMSVVADRSASHVCLRRRMMLLAGIVAVCSRFDGGPRSCLPHA